MSWLFLFALIAWIVCGIVLVDKVNNKYRLAVLIVFLAIGVPFLSTAFIVGMVFCA